MINLAYLVVGVVVTEVVFVYPGMGQYLVDHVAKRDVPVVQACGLIFAAVYIGAQHAGGRDLDPRQPAAEASEMRRIPALRPDRADHHRRLFPGRASSRR